MLKMRLMRFGAKKKPHYRIVVLDSTKPRQSKALDVLGYYSPLEEPARVKVDLERAKQWLSKGVKPSRTVQSLLDKLSSPVKPTQVTKS